jgi:hypothetical protein
MPNWKEDQVVRRHNFSEVHPEVNFEFRCETGKWEATYPTGGNGARTVYGSELGEVLDKLEKHFGVGHANDQSELNGVP